MGLFTFLQQPQTFTSTVLHTSYKEMLMTHDVHIKESFLLLTPVTVLLSAKSFLCSRCLVTSIAGTIRTRRLTGGLGQKSTDGLTELLVPSSHLYTVVFRALADVPIVLQMPVAPRSHQLHGCGPCTIKHKYVFLRAV